MNKALLETATKYHELGLAIIPFYINPEGEKKPKIAKWEKWETQPQTDKEFEALHIEKYNLFGVVCGTPIIKDDDEKVYFNVVDRDIKDPKLTEETKAKSLKALNRLPATQREKSRSGGQHVLIYSRKQAKGKKLNDVGMELLALGNLAVMAPSEGYSTELSSDLIATVDNIEDVFFNAIEAEGLGKNPTTQQTAKIEFKPAPLRPCFTKLMEKAHLEHLEKVALIYEMYYSGMTPEQIADIFQEHEAWEPKPEHTFDPNKTANQINYTLSKAKEGNFRYKSETLAGTTLKICFPECDLKKLADCRKLPPTLEELKEKSRTIKEVMEGDFKNYETVDDGLAWFIATLYENDFSVSDVKEALEKLHNETWIKGSDFFKKRIFGKAKKIMDAEKAKYQENDTMESQADKVYKILKESDTELFHDQNGTEYARITIEVTDTTDATDAINDRLICKVGESIEGGALSDRSSHIATDENCVSCVNASKTKPIVRLKDEKFAHFLAHIYYEVEGKILITEAITQVLRLLNYEAAQAKQYTLFNRVAPDPTGDGSIWLDVADKLNRAYHVTIKGWSLETEVPILFRRYDHQKPLAIAVKGGSAQKLLPFVNIGASKTSELTKRRQLLLLIQTASYAIPNIPRPINAMFGCPGSHKSTAQRFIREIFDPSEVPYLRPPRDDNAALQVLDHHYIPIFDNLQYIPDWFSEMLCGGVTGAGQESRALFTDDDSFIRSFKRCIMLNGVSLPATKGDLLNRTIMHPTEPNVERRTEKELNAEYEKVKPEILGGFLDVLVKALNFVLTVQPLKLFRLADFSEWGYRLAVAFDAIPEDFEKAMEENLANQNSADIENNIVADAFLAYCKKYLEYTSESNPKIATPEEILKAVALVADDRGTNTKSKKWPNAAAYFTRKLNDSKNAIIASGWNYEVVPMGSKREMRIWSVPLDNEEWFSQWVTITKKMEACHVKFNISWLPTNSAVSIREGLIKTYDFIKAKHKELGPFKSDLVENQALLKILLRDGRVFEVYNGYIAPTGA